MKNIVGKKFLVKKNKSTPSPLKLEQTVELTNKEDIENWLNKMNIRNYTINDDLSVDVNGTVDIENKKLTLIPVKFNIVKGAFVCSNNYLKSLKNSPNECDRFYADNNKLEDLEFLPKVKGFISINHNPFISIIDLSPEYILNNNLKQEFSKYSKVVNNNSYNSLLYICNNDFDIVYNYFDFWLDKYPALYNHMNKILPVSYVNDLQKKHQHLKNSSNFDLL